MADSDNTTTLPVVTRRKLLAGTTFTAALWPAGAGAEATPLDPAVALWEEWREACCRLERLCRVQQTLETKLIAGTGSPSSTVPASETGQGRASSTDQLAGTIGTRRETVVDERSIPEFAECRARWDAVDAELGYSAARQAEECQSARKLDPISASNIDPLGAAVARSGSEPPHSAEPVRADWIDDRL